MTNNELPILSDAQVAATNVSRSRSWFVHLIRVAIFFSIIFLARVQHQSWIVQARAKTVPSVDLSTIQPHLPAANSVSKFDPATDGQIVFDEEGKRIGFAIQTSPESDSIVGYAGATNLLILFDELDIVTRVEILSSSDTDEHVEMIVNDDQFLPSFSGADWQTTSSVTVDAVSGATLTSLAIEESIHRRLGNNQPSLRFPDPLTVAELRKANPIFANAASFLPSETRPKVFEVLDDSAERLGSFIRTTPDADSINGYQGPSDALLLLDRDRKAIGVWLRSSFDNEKPEPFVRYVQEDGYLNRFVADQTLKEFEEDASRQFEGVSGATMTSQGVYDGLKHAAKIALNTKPPAPATIEFSWRDLGTIVVLLFALVMCFTRANAIRWLRYLFQFVLIGYFGFLNGDLLSQTLLAGWAKSGVPWRYAIGLVLLVMASLAVPIFSKRNIYCHHVCPFGAAQQLIRTQIKKPLSISKSISRGLELIPVGLVVFVFGVVFFRSRFNLASIEPFDAFSVRAAGIATISVAVVGLIASCFVPMAYCRFGCPTGSVLEFLRRTRRSDRIGAGDWLAVGLVCVAVVIWFW